MTLGAIQLTMFPTDCEFHGEAETVELMRLHKWAHGGTDEIPLVSIELAPHEGLWMWQSSLNSHNGASQCAKALPKWNRFAGMKIEALMAGVRDVQVFMHRATAVEQVRILDWLSDQVARISAYEGTLVYRGYVSRS